MMAQRLNWWQLAGLILLLGCWSSVVQADDSVCLQCHAAQPDALGAAVVDWQESVHAANGISCHDCHGGDPTDFAMAMEPERGFLGVPEEKDIPGFCGRCHIGVAEIYQDSAHGQALASGGPNCVTCHDNHQIKEAEHDLINEKDCSRCHSYERAAEIKQAVEEIDRGIASADTDLSQLGRIGIRVKPLQDKLFALRNDYHRLFHTVEIEKVRKAAGEYRSRLTEIITETAGINAQLDTRKKWGAGVAVLLVVAGILLLQLKKTYDQGGDDQS